MKKDFAPFVYGLYDPAEAGHIRYVGMAGTRPERPYDHAIVARRSKKNSYLLNWIRQVQAGEREPAVLVLEQLNAGASLKFVGEIEKMYISSLRRIGHRLTNISEGGGGRSGPHTPETIERIRKANANQKGVSPSAETRALLSLLNKGRKLGPKTPEQIANLSRAKKGSTHVVNPGTAEKISEGLRAAWARRKANGTDRDSPEARENKRRAHLKRYENPEAHLATGAAVKASWPARRQAAEELRAIEAEINRRRKLASDLMIGEA
jgi:hypothetical protein